MKENLIQVGDNPGGWESLIQLMNRSKVKLSSLVMTTAMGHLKLAKSNYPITNNDYKAGESGDHFSRQ